MDVVGVSDLIPDKTTQVGRIARMHGFSRRAVSPIRHYFSWHNLREI